MDPTKSFKSYVQTVQHRFPSDLFNHHPVQYSRSSREHHRGRTTEPYPTPVRRTRIYSPPPRNKISKGNENTNHLPRHNTSRKVQVIGDEKRMITPKKSQRGHGSGTSQRNRGRSPGQGRLRSNVERKMAIRQEAELMMQQVGQGVMNELTRVVDTVSSDLKLVSEQLKNLSNSMSESMMLSSFVRDPDLSMTSHGGHHIHPLIH